MHKQFFVRIEPPVLIETYWNVNMVKLIKISISQQGINRNILECKFGFSIRIYCSLTVLIETYWNVNVFGYVSIEKQKIVLIETYWNVNDNQKLHQEIQNHQY